MLGDLNDRVGKNEPTIYTNGHVNIDRIDLFFPSSQSEFTISLLFFDSAPLGVILSFVLMRPLLLTHGLCNLIPARRPPRNPFGESYLHSLKSSGKEKYIYKRDSHYSALFHPFTLSVCYFGNKRKIIGNF